MANIAAAALRGFLVSNLSPKAVNNCTGIADNGIKLIFGGIILGLSVSLAKQQVIGSPPPETSFYSFAGAFGIIVSALAILAMFVDQIPTIGVMVADALASVFYIAGAIVGLTH